jgi:threonine-phosphate decarboxylase
MKDKAYPEESRLANDRRRLWLEQELARLKIATYPSSANFLLLRFSAKVDVSQLWEK